MWSDRLRELLYPFLIVFIVGSLWMVGRAGEIEADSQYTLAPAPQWHELQAQLYADEEPHAALAD